MINKLLCSLCFLFTVCGQSLAEDLSVTVLKSNGEQVKGKLLGYEDGSLALQTDGQKQLVYWPNVIELSIDSVARTDKSKRDYETARALFAAGHDNLACYFFDRAITRDKAIKETVAKLYKDAGKTMPKDLSTSFPSPEELVPMTRRLLKEARGLEKQFTADAKKIVPGIRLLETSQYLIYTTRAKEDDKLILSLLDRQNRAFYEYLDMDSKVHRMMGKLPIYIFESQRDYARFTSKVAGVPASSVMTLAGYTAHMEYEDFNYFYTAIGSVRSPGVTEKESLVKFHYIMTHEATHSLMNRAFSERRMPNWVDEGIAEYITAKLVPESVAGDRWKNIQKMRDGSKLTVRSIQQVMRAPLIPRSDLSYGIAQALIRQLDKIKPGKMLMFVKKLKQGSSVAISLKDVYEITEQDLIKTVMGKE